MKVSEICKYAPKSNIKARDACDGGKYVFFTSSADESKRYNAYQHEGEGIIMGTGGNATLHYYDGKYAVSTDCIVLLPNEQIRCKYLYYFFLGNMRVLERGFKGAGLKHTNKGYIGDIDIGDIPSFERQEKIIGIFDTLQSIIDLRKSEIERLDNLIKARFVEMFGDMYLNSKGWPEAKLESMADVVSGITKGRKTKAEDLTEVPYMAVSNVKDGYIDWTTVKTIEATQQEIEQYRLLADDVLMTEGGDPDKVGRGAIIKEPLENCIHQNHIFRVRLDESMILPEFFAEYLQHQRSKRYFLGCAKQTTGIASINMTQLRALPVLMPPLSKQEEFVLFKAQVNKSKVAVQKALDETQLLFDSLMQEYFG